MLRGDFKARTGNAVDMTPDKRNQYFSWFDTYKIDNDIFNRVSEIPVLKERIRTIKTRIMNGKCFGDTFRNYTSHNYHGSSVIEYLLTDEVFVQNVLFFWSIRFYFYIIRLSLYAIMEYLISFWKC